LELARDDLPPVLFPVAVVAVVDRSWSRFARARVEEEGWQCSIFVVFGSNLLSLQRGEILRFNYMHHRSRNFTQEESVKGGKVRKLLRMKFCFFSI
jgi:hypothetical protein